jgi:transposase
MTVSITRRELSAGELRREARRCRDAADARPGAGARRGLAGGGGAARRHGPADAPGLGAPLQRPALRLDRGAEGLPGLRDRPRSGRRPRLTAEQGTELAAVVERGPDPERDGVVRWRRVDLRALIKARYDVELHERSVGKVLHRLGFARLSVRPKHPKADAAAQAAFRQTSASW